MVDVLVIGGGNAALCAALPGKPARPCCCWRLRRGNGEAETLSTRGIFAVCTMLRRMF